MTEEIAPLQKEPVWSNERNYYDHMRALWEDVRLARKMLNNSPNGNIYDGFRAMEDWFEAQKALIDKLAPFMDAKVLAEVDGRVKDIKELTQGQLFATLGTLATSSMWVEIKSKLEQNERAISIEMADLGLYMRRKSKKNMDEYLV